MRDVFDQDHTLQAYLGRPESSYDRGIFGRYMNWNTWLESTLLRQVGEEWRGGDYFRP